jgi:hypothetical protein
MGTFFSQPSKKPAWFEGLRMGVSGMALGLAAMTLVRLLGAPVDTDIERVGMFVGMFVGLFFHFRELRHST